MKFEPGAQIRFDVPSVMGWLRGKRPFRRTEEGETAYRLGKQAAQARGDYTEAGRYHYAEQCAIEARARKESSFCPCRKAFWTRTLTWLARLLLGRIIFGYGERPYYPLLLALAVIACWTGLYYSLDAIEPNPANEAALAEPATLGESLYFSLVTFTTLGYGDFKPKPDYRLLAGAEAALGAGLMATFIVCLTRKYMR
ncbi:MAG: potassium channel family protein [Phycisphaerae bacterium]